MGVNGLWEIVAPAARPVNLDNLADQRLAIDASIWIYHFLKAMRDSDGHVVKHAHVIGFFRRICKLIYFGILPVFVFDGGAPVLKRNTIRNRKERRKNREMTAKETAERILTLQLHKIMEERKQKPKKLTKKNADESSDDEDDMVYLDEIGLDESQRHSTKTGKSLNPATIAASNMTEDEIRIKKASDPYFLPELETEDLMNKIKPNDPRFMTQEELDQFGKEIQTQMHSGLYDESLNDFESSTFKNLPVATQYQLLSTARLRSRLRMGFTVDQLTEKFTDRLEFSKFQVERVRQRNYLTQRLMNLATSEAQAAIKTMGMTSASSSKANFQTTHGRVASVKGREYILQKGDSGWALSFGKDDNNKPIVIDDDIDLRDDDIVLLERQKRNRDVEIIDDDDDEDEDEDIEWEDVVPSASNNPETLENAYDKRNQDFLAKLPDAFKNFETNVQRAQLYEKLKERAQDASEKAFVFEDDDDNESPMVTNESATSQPVADTKDKTSHNFDSSTLSFGSSLFSQRKSNLDSKPQETLISSSQSITSGRTRNSPEGLSSHNSTTKSGRNSTAQDPSRQTDNSEDVGVDLTTPQSTTFVPPWFQSTGVDNPTNQLNLSGQSSVASTLNFPPKTYNHVPESTNTFRNKANLQKNISGFNIADIDSSSSENEEGLVSYQEILDKRREKENIGISRVMETDKSALVVIESDSENEIADKSVEIMNVIQKGTDKASMETNLNRSSLVSDPATDTKDTFGINVLPAKSYRRAGPISAIVNEPETPSDLKDSQPLEKPVNEEIGSDNLIPDEKSITTDSTLQEVPHNSDYELALALQEEDYLRQEDEDLYESFAQELEETKRFAESFKPKTSFSTFVPSSSSSTNQQGNHFNDFANNIPDLSGITSVPAISYDDELISLRRAARKELRDADEVTPQMVSEIQSLLQLFGIPYITAPMEAESQCSALFELGLVDGIVTDDSDIFLFGGTRVFKNMFSQRNSKYVECYDMDNIEKEIGLTRDKLVELAYLVGSDYTDGLSGVGPVTAMEILANFVRGEATETNNLAELTRFKEWWKGVQSKTPAGEPFQPLDKSFERTFSKKVTKVFLPTGFPDPQVREAYINPEVDHDNTPFEWGLPNLDTLRSFLVRAAGWTSDKTDELLLPAIQKMNSRKTKQGKKGHRVDNFFLTSQLANSHHAQTTSRSKKGSHKQAPVSELAAAAEAESYEKRKNLTTLKGKSTRMKKAIDLIQKGKRSRNQDDKELSSSEEASITSVLTTPLDGKSSNAQPTEDYESSSDDDNDLSSLMRPTKKTSDHSPSDPIDHAAKAVSVSKIVKDIRASKLNAASRKGNDTPAKATRKRKASSTEVRNPRSNSQVNTAEEGEQPGPEVNVQDAPLATDNTAKEPPRKRRKPILKTKASKTL